MSDESDLGAANSSAGTTESISSLEKFNAVTGAVGAVSGVASYAKDMGESGAEADGEGLISGILDAGSELLDSVWDILGW